MAPRLKVFSWSDGFHSWTVATSSRPKALQAWGVEQDLFKSGLAHEIGPGPERDAALASPGTVIRTGMAIDPGVIEALKPDPAQARRQKSREAVRAIQLEIDALDAALSGQQEALRAEREAIDARMADLERVMDKKRAALEKSLKTARF